MPESNPNTESPNLSSSNNSAKEPERQRMEALLSALHWQAKAQGKENATITVQAGRPIIYRGVPGQDPLPRDIPTETILKVLQAVENPQALNGTVKLSVDGDVAFYNQKGNVAQDTYKIAQQHEVAQKLEINPSSQPEPASEIEQLKGRVDQLEALVAKQQQHIHGLEQRTNVIGSAPILKVGNKLGNWLEDVRNKVGKTLQQTGEHLSKRIEQDKDLLESYKTNLQTARQEISSAYNQVQTAYDKGADRHHAVNNAVFKAAQEVASGVVDAAKYANAVVAKHQSKPTLTDNNQIPKEPPIPPTVRASELWKHYSEKVNVTGPFQTATAVAQTAWREGVAEADIRKILAANPVLSQFGKKAQELVELPLKQVKRAVQLADKSSSQQSKPITYFPNVDR